MPARGTAPSLADLQGWLVAVSTDAAGVEFGVERAGRAYAVGAANVAELERVVTPGPRLSAIERLAIYHDGYFARLVECLADDYPALKYALGDSEFEHVLRDYIDAHPSCSPSLNAYGAALPSYLCSRDHGRSSFASDLARLEWAIVEVIHAETRPPLGADALGAVGPEDFARAVLVASPALRVLEFDYPVNRFYQAFRDETTPELPAPAPSAVAIHRQELVVYRLELEPAMRVLLVALTQGETLGAALGALERTLSPGELAAARGHLSAWFGAWTASGFFTALALA
jgi:Putative DNA-binding domain